MQKKRMDFLQAVQKNNLSLFDDADKDHVPNVFDCKPYDKNKDGLLGRALHVVSRGSFGQSKEDYDIEKAIRNRQPSLEELNKRNKVLEAKIQAQRLMVERQQLQFMQGPPVNPTQALFSNVFGIPLPKPKGVPLGRPGYEVVYAPSLPKGFHWRKISKKEGKQEHQNRSTPNGVEHRFMSHHEAQFAQHRIRQMYGYTPEIFKVTDPFSGMVFFVVVEPAAGNPL